MRYESYRTRLLQILALKQAKITRHKSFFILELLRKAVHHDFATLTSSELVMLMTSRQFTSILTNFFLGILNRLQTSISQGNGRATRAFYSINSTKCDLIHNSRSVDCWVGPKQDPCGTPHLTCILSDSIRGHKSVNRQSVNNGANFFINSLIR